MLSNNATVEVKPFPTKSASEFLNALRRELLEGQGKPPDFTSPWLCRGHADADWELKPSAWRADGQEKLKPLIDWLRTRDVEFAAPCVDEDDHKRTVECNLQIVAEVYAVRQFCDVADQLGLTIPGAEEVLGLKGIIECVKHRSGSFYLGVPYELKLFIPYPFAFAQHHGIPTRFLDWTCNPYVAAFFAADGAKHVKYRTSEDICVWAVSEYAVQASSGINWVKIPRGKHEYLHAQSGLFSFQARADDVFCQNGCVWPTFKEALQRSRGQARIVLNKFTLPASESEKLLTMLFTQFTSRAHLMPTLDNVGEEKGSSEEKGSKHICEANA
ncbi:MAG: FRG domain-containing protein [Bacillota bacterium]